MSHRTGLLETFSLASWLLLLASHGVLAAPGPSVTPGFPNVAQTPGAILSGLNAPGQGRTAVLAYHNGILFTVPEVPSSQPGADFQVRTWDISDPTSPVELAQHGTTAHPISAHGYFKSGDYLIIGPNWPPEAPWSFRANGPFNLQRTTFPEMTCSWSRSCLFGPWRIDQTFWSYDEVSGNAAIVFDWNSLSEWDHLGQTGVIGHPFLIGDLLIFASDQSRTGVATYDVSDPTNPVLLDILTTGGPGGYWPELWGNDGELYIVFPYRTGGNGFRVVDATDPSDLRFVTDRSLPGDESMYIQFQDEFAFMGSHKVDMRTFESVLYLDGANTARPNQPGQVGINTSQHLLPIGNLLVTGGIGSNEGMAIWAHQAAPDTRGPSVGFHIPQAGRTNYPNGAPITLLIHETLETMTIINGQTFIVRPLGGSAISGRITFSFEDVLTFQPDNALADDTTYEVVLPAGGIKDAAGNGIDGYSFTFSTGSSLNGNAPPTITSFAVAHYPVPPSTSTMLSASATDGDGDSLEYRFDFGDGSAKTAWSSTSSVPITYDEIGHYRAAVQVRDPAGSIASESLTVTVLTAPAGTAPTRSSSIACDRDDRTIWVVNPDNDTVASVDADTLAVDAEFAACDDPRSVAVDAAGNLWVACHDDDRVVVLSPTGNELAGIDTGHGSAPVGVAVTPNGATAFVSLQGSGSLIRLATATRQQTGSLDLGPNPRAIAVTSNGNRVLVSRLLSPRNHAEVWDVNASAFTLNGTIIIPKFGGDENFDSTAAGRGVANYLVGITIAPDGQSAWIAANKPNTERGLLFFNDLDQDNTVRNIIVQIDLTSNTVIRAIDIDNSDSASAVAFSPLGDYLLATLQGNNEVVAFDTLNLAQANGLGSFVTRLGAGSAPQGICIDPDTGRSFVKNLMSRNVTALETDDLFRLGAVSVSSGVADTVANETMTSSVRSGKEIFYNAGDQRMSAEGYISCATCHLDGGHDGRSWDFTGRGEGMRNTTTLRGRGGTAHGNVHWTANFDEIQDFENDIRNNFGGSGFLSDPDFAATSNTLGAAKAGRSADLDALADYVTSLSAATIPRSPWRNSDGTMTAQAQSGATHFANLGCAGCHLGAEFTDSTLGGATLHDVGTIRTSSGQRLNGPLTGIDTPTLLGAWATAPYFHDGSAASVEDVFRIAGGTVLQAEDGSVSGGASVQNQWLQFNNDDTVHGRALVAFQLSSGGASPGNGPAFTFFNVDGGTGGIGAVEARYTSGYGVFNLEVTVNGVTHSAPLPLLGNNPQWRHTNWGTVRIEGITFNAGTTNTVRISTTSNWANISIDEIVVSGPQDLGAAQPHRGALSLSQSERDELVAYLLQLEGTAAAPTATPTPDNQPATPTSTQTATDTPNPTATPIQHSISGDVRSASDGSMMPGALVALDGGWSDSQTTTGSGTYSFAGLTQTTWTVSASRNGGTSGAVSPLDASWALQSAIGSRLLSPTAALACDVSGNGSVSAFDASRILQHLVGQMPTFTVAEACGSDWLFVPEGPGASAPVISSGTCQPGSFGYSPLSTPVGGANFVAAAFGDCTLNGAAAAQGAAAISGLFSDAPIVVVGPQRRSRRKYLRIPISVSGTDAVSSLDLNLRYDGEALRLRRVRKASGVTALVRGAEPSPDGTRVVLAAGTPIPSGNRPLLYLIFERLQRRSARIEVVEAKVDDRSAGIRSQERRSRRR